MRTLVDIPQEDLAALDLLSKAEKRSRAAVIRAAISDYLAEKDRQRRWALIETGFGIWKDRGIDGLEYERAIRAEWDRDPSE